MNLFYCLSLTKQQFVWHLSACGVLCARNCQRCTVSTLSIHNLMLFTNETVSVQPTTFWGYTSQKIFCKPTTDPSQLVFGAQRTVDSIGDWDEPEWATCTRILASRTTRKNLKHKLFYLRNTLPIFCLLAFSQNLCRQFYHTVGQ